LLLPKHRWLASVICVKVRHHAINVQTQMRGTLVGRPTGAQSNRMHFQGWFAFKEGNTWGIAF